MHFIIGVNEIIIIELSVINFIDTNVKFIAINFIFYYLKFVEEHFQCLLLYFLKLFLLIKDNLKMK
jgi:hypothetical protein